MVGTVNTNSFQVTGLSTDTAYSFNVKAKDAAGNISPPSNTVGVITQSSGSSRDFCLGSITSFPYAEGFENTLGLWTQETEDNFNWTVNANRTPSRNTGPSRTVQGTYYVYMESSSPNYPAKRAILNSPCFDLSAITEATISFQYYMYGKSNMGSLALEASDDDGNTWTSIWSKSGNQGNLWVSENINLSVYVGSNIRLRFNGITGATLQGDMAIDAISLTEGTGEADCTDAILTINFDDYPEETSWRITNVGNQVVASGGTYDSQPDGSTLIITECLDAGTYTFTLNDSFGDGICCEYGNGSYSLASDEITIASGGSFGSSESITFTVGNRKEPITDKVITTSQNVISITPNPVGESGILNIISTKGTITFTIIDLYGRKINSGVVKNKSINVQQLPTGLYLLHLNIEGKVLTKRFIKE